jgi:hypothetical protein
LVGAGPRAILSTLEGGGADGPRPVHPDRGEAPQLGLFDRPAPGPERVVEDEVLEALRRVDPDELSPRAAWDMLASLRKKLTLPS